jgi:cytidine deaminase
MTASGIPQSARAGVDVARLIEGARVARQNAHAPYSRYRVGAALLAEDGRVFYGVNVENSAYPTSLCAEHNAIGSAITAGARRFRAIAVATEPKAGKKPGAPCGKCRQALSEFGLELLVVLAAATGDEHELVMLSDLLPRSFSGEEL